MLQAGGGPGGLTLQGSQGPTANQSERDDTCPIRDQQHLPLMKELSGLVRGSMQAPPGRISTRSRLSLCCSTSSSADVSDGVADSPSVLITSARRLFAAEEVIQGQTQADTAALISFTCSDTTTCLNNVFVFDLHLLPRSFVATVGHAVKRKQFDDSAAAGSVKCSSEAGKWFRCKGSILELRISLTLVFSRVDFISDPLPGLLSQFGGAGRVGLGC